jgi:hypothetical protein
MVRLTIVLALRYTSNDRLLGVHLYWSDRLERELIALVSVSVECPAAAIAVAAAGQPTPPPALRTCLVRRLLITARGRCLPVPIHLRRVANAVDTCVVISTSCSQSLMIALAIYRSTWSCRPLLTWSAPCDKLSAPYRSYLSCLRLQMYYPCRDR